MTAKKYVLAAGALFELERRTCSFPKCEQAFWVLVGSLQVSCCIDHVPGAVAAHRWQGKPKAMGGQVREKHLDRQRMIRRVRELYAEAKSSTEIIAILNGEGFRKPRRGEEIDEVFLNNFRSRHLIDIPEAARQRPGRRKKA